MKRFIQNLKDDSTIAAKAAFVVTVIFTLIELPIVWLYLLSRYVMAFVCGLASLLTYRLVVWLCKTAYRAIKNKDVC